MVGGLLIRTIVRRARRKDPILWRHRRERILHRVEGRYPMAICLEHISSPKGLHWVVQVLFLLNNLTILNNNLTVFKFDWIYYTSIGSKAPESRLGGNNKEEHNNGHDSSSVIHFDCVQQFGPSGDELRITEEPEQDTNNEQDESGNFMECHWTQFVIFVLNQLLDDWLFTPFTRRRPVILILDQIRIIR